MTSLYSINYYIKAHKRDPLIEFIKGLLLNPFVLSKRSLKKFESDEELEVERVVNINKFADILFEVEGLIQEYMNKSSQGLREYSRLYRLVPSVGTFFTPLPLRDAFEYVDKKFRISARKFVPPSFNEIRWILNIAQVKAISSKLKLITFDGDMTLYEDGKDFEADNKLVHLITNLLKAEVFVAVVTAAGYGNDCAAYERRLSGLLKGFKDAGLEKQQVARFFVLGGECHFLFQCDETCHLKYIETDQYQPKNVYAWSEAEIQALLNAAQTNLEKCINKLNLPAIILRKAKAIGIIPESASARIRREQLDECALSTQQYLTEFLATSTEIKTTIPFCAFNGGRDVWVDVGNKLIGVQVLQDYLDILPNQCLHVGDQFLSTGNDHATRSACCTVWIVNPEETHEILTELNEELESHRLFERNGDLSHRSSDVSDLSSTEL